MKEWIVFLGLFGALWAWAIPLGHQGQIIEHDFYSLSYDENHEQAAWVSYELTDEMLQRRVARSNDFRPDQKVWTGSATLEDYRGSGYDRGHLVPAGDMTFERNAMSQTFLMSNMSPQIHEFNSGIWNELESLSREWAKNIGDLRVVTGPLLEEGLPVIGQNEVSIPDFFFKVIFLPQGQQMQMVAFLIPQQGPHSSLWNYALSVDEVEEMTGLDFFSELPDHIENVLEASTDFSGWP